MSRRPGVRRAMRPGRCVDDLPTRWESKVYRRRGRTAWTEAPGASNTGGWGGTQPRLFLVGDLPEFIETEPNSQPEKAERITLPVVVNGQIAGERDLDFFVFAAKVGEVVVFDTMAARIGSPLDPVVEITDAKGKRMAVEQVRVGTDPVLAFRVPATGDYRVSIANVSFHGGPQYVYRMTVSTEPFVASVFPPRGKAGETQEVEILTLTGTGTPRVQKERVTFPTVPGPFRLHNSIALVAGEHAEIVATGDNHSASSAMELTASVSVSDAFWRPTRRTGSASQPKKARRSLSVVVLSRNLPPRLPVVAACSTPPASPWPKPARRKAPTAAPKSTGPFPPMATIACAYAICSGARVGVRNSSTS